jgi:hypothetical protein
MKKPRKTFSIRAVQAEIRISCLPNKIQYVTAWVNLLGMNLYELQHLPIVGCGGKMVIDSEIIRCFTNVSLEELRKCVGT